MRVKVYLERQPQLEAVARLLEPVRAEVAPDRKVPTGRTQPPDSRLALPPLAETVCNQFTHSPIMKGIHTSLSFR